MSNFYKSNTKLKSCLTTGYKGSADNLDLKGDLRDLMHAFPLKGGPKMDQRESKGSQRATKMQQMLEKRHAKNDAKI